MNILFVLFRMLISENPGSEILVITFGGHDGSLKNELGFSRYDWVKFIEHTYTNVHQVFIRAYASDFYLGAVKDLGTKNIDETIQKLKDIISLFPDVKRIIFVGSSGGGYPAILFGSILKADAVLTFLSPTHITEHIAGERNISEVLDKVYLDVNNFINDVTQYHLIFDPTDLDWAHRIAHADHLKIKNNMHIYREPRFSLWALLRSGKLRVKYLNQVFYPGQKHEE